MESWGGPRRSNADRRTGDPAPVEQLPATPAARIGFADRVMVTASGARQPIVAILLLISFFTVGEDECRAWNIRAGTTAVEAAGEIPTDLQQGFIRAEGVKDEGLVAAGGLAAGRNRGPVELGVKEVDGHHSGN